MPRQRMVKPDFFDSGSLTECSHTARLAFIGLWVMGDDKGNMKLSVKKLKKQIFPFDDMDSEEFVSALGELERVGCIKAYEVDGDEYLSVVNFSVYQTVKNPSKTNIPCPPDSLKKVKRTHRFKNTGGGLTQCYHTPVTGGETTGESVAQEGGSSGTAPALPQHRSPSKERSKEVILFPSEKSITPTASDGAAAAEAAPPPRCPECGGSMTFDAKDGFWRCRECRATTKQEHLEDRGRPVCPMCHGPVSKRPEGIWTCDLCGTIKAPIFEQEVQS